MDCGLRIEYNALINWNPDPPPPPPRAYMGQCGGFLWYLKAWLARGGGGFLRICLAYSWQSMEVVPCEQ